MPNCTRSVAALVAGVLLLAIPSQGLPPQESPSLLGFSPDAATAQVAREQAFDREISKADLRSWLEHLAARPHHVGSEWGRQNAEWMRDLFTSWGYETRIESFEVLYPTPTRRRLERVAPSRFVARLDEGSLREDPTSALKREQLPGFNIYSVDGNVEGELVYVNYGLPADYETLAQHGIDVRGKIVLARYGGSWRGVKPKVAAEHGAIGCILYSDPRDDGYALGDAWPLGGWRSRDAVQRGSVADMPIHAGDPLTPGVGATADAKRLSIAEAKTLTRIPVLPISYGDAAPLLQALAGPVAPEGWRGALPFSYRLGPGPARVHLELAFDWSLRSVHDVIAVLPGSELPDEWIVRGNHHDAWVFGAMDPVSGMVSLLAEAKATAALARSGFRPRRTLVFAAWDGEEAGLLGSTEWAETHADELRRKVVAYLNTDSISRGLLGVGGSASLERLVNEVGRTVLDPERGVSVAERAKAAAIASGDAATRSALRSRADLRLEALGSGSDFTPFLQHLGIAALNLSFGGEEQYGQYHSVYDSIAHFERFGDPGFDYVAKSAEVGGRLMLRLSEAEILPFTLDRTAEAIERYAAELPPLTDSLRQEAEERTRLLADRSLELAADPGRGSPRATLVPPSDRRSRPVHRVRRENAAGDPRGDRRAPLGRGEPPDSQPRRAPRQGTDGDRRADREARGLPQLSLSIGNPPREARPARGWARLGVVLEMIKFEHTLFALPFALMGMLLAAGGLPEGRVVLWIVVAMVGARSAAMGWNRLVDREIDAANPRTVGRALPAGLVTPRFVLLFVVVSLALLLLAAWRLNPLCLWLSPVAIVVLLGYSYTKRFTWGAHLALGVALAGAPLGAWIAVRGSVATTPFVLAAAVVTWVAGFDVLYALQDEAFDRARGLSSIPARFGTRAALIFSAALHLTTLALLGLLPTVYPAGLGVAYGVGVVGCAALLLYQHSIVRPGELSRLNAAFFTANGVLALWLLAATAADLLLR